jgi:hypothetical protein
MDLFGLLRITWLPGGQPARSAQPPRVEPPPLQPPEEPPEVPAVKVPPVAPEPDVIRSLIGLADDLAELAGRDWTGQSATRTLRLMQWRVDKVLAESGVQAVSDDGPVVPARHEVVGAEPVSAGTRPGWIAGTVRRGYQVGDQLIRPQQVIAYVAAEPATSHEEASDAEGGTDAERG